MSLDAGSVYATLGGRFSPSGFAAFDGAMHKSHRNVNVFERGIDRSMSRSSRAMHAVGRAATTGAGVGILAVGAAMVGAVKKAADFESQLSSLQAVSGANAREMAKFKQQALAAGAATKFSALDAAQAQTELAKGGMSLADIMGGGLKGALGLAAAGELDLADAAAYTANAMNLFGLQGDQATHVADALAAAANATTADVSDFGMALVQGGSAAKAAGLSFDQTVAALEALASIGVKGSDAGTSLKAALVQLASPTKKSANLMGELGLKFFDAHGKMKPLASIAGMLRDKLGGLTKEQRLQAATTLVGTDGMRALLALYDAGPEKVKGFEDGLARQGTAAEVAAKKQDNLKGKLENLQGSLETAAIVVGTELIPVLQDAAVDLTDFVNRAAASGDIQRFGRDMAGGLRDVIGVLPTVAHGIGDVASTAGDAIGVVVALVNAFGGLDVVGPALLGAAAGLLAFRGIAAVAPMVLGLATAIGDVMLAFRAGGAAFAASTLLSMINPVTAVAAAFVGLGAIIAVTAGQESYEEGIARRSADAKRAQADAVRDLASAEQAAAGATLGAQRADLEHERALRDLNRLKKEGKQGTLEYKDAQLRVNETAHHAAQAHKEEGDALRKRLGDDRKLLDTAEKRAAATDKELRQARILAREGGGQSRKDAADAEKRHTEALRQLTAARIRAGISEINYQRALQGAPAIHKRNAVAVHDLFAQYSNLPKRVLTRLLATNEDALGKIARLSNRLGDLGHKKTVAKILASSSSAEEAIRRLQSYLNGLHDKNITITTTHRSVGSKARPNARGTRTKGAEKAVIGEGAGPEYRFNPDGSGYKTAGPEMTVLEPGTTIVPTEARYRGRGIDLWMQAGHDLGVPGYKAGVRKAAKKKPPKPPKPPPRFIPPPLDPLRLPVDDIEKKSTDAKGKYSDQKGKVDELERTANQKKTRENAGERARARGKLPDAKKLRDKLEAIWRQRAKEAREARENQAKITEQEQLVEIARQDMESADKRDDQGAYDDAKTRRGTALTKLKKLIADAQKHVKKDSAYYNQLQIELGQLGNDEIDLAKEKNEPEIPPDAPTLTREQQAQLDEIEAAQALAEVDTPDDFTDDKAAGGRKVEFLQGVLQALRQGGAPSSAIRDIARDLTSAREELKNIGTGGSKDQDLEAIAAQARERERVANDRARLSEAALGVFGPAGSAPPGGAPQTIVNLQSFVPPDRKWIEQVGRIATDGQASQGHRESPRVRLGV
jgi:TP901 family phage tail tape measure protein